MISPRKEVMNGVSIHHPRAEKMSVISLPCDRRESEWKMCCAVRASWAKKRNESNEANLQSLFAVKFHLNMTKLQANHKQDYMLLPIAS